MAIVIRMPALSPTMTEGKLSTWLKGEGDSVRSGDVLAEIETDKATMEVEATDEGVLGRIVVASGTEGVLVNAPIAVLLEEGEDESALQSALESLEAPAGAKSDAGQAAPAAPARADTASKDAAPEVVPVPDAPSSKPRPAAGADRSAPGPGPVGASGAAAGPGQKGRIAASPLARRLARESGIALERITGSGPRGRIVKADIDRAIASGVAGEGAMAVGGGLHAGMGQDFPPASGQSVPHSKMRQIIASRLSESKQTVPHFYATLDCHLDALLSLRKEINEIDDSLKLSVNDFIIRASALALKQVPEANVSWTDEGMIHYDLADVAVAVATDSGGLITPIVRAADRKGVAAISLEVKDLAARARQGKLLPEEYQGGSFTVSNMGMFGIREFSAIINPPQACILAVGAGEPRPVVLDGALAVATVMTVTLSCDHRAVDGAVGARWLGAFKALIEHPVRLIL